MKRDILRDCRNRENANRAAALAIAKQELKAAELKVAKLSRYKEIPWIDRMMHL
jgi:hypothetical protein